MDDFVVRVRQLAQYPFKPAAAATDYVLLQQVGIGGPYASTHVLGLLKGFEDASASLGIGVNALGLQVPADALGSQLFAGGLILPGHNGDLLWNVYSSTSGDRFWSSGPGGALTFNGIDGYAISYFPGGGAGAQLNWTSANWIMTLSPQGDMWLSGHYLGKTTTQPANANDLSLANTAFVQAAIWNWMREASPNIVCATAPQNPPAGMLWFDNVTAQLFIWTGSEWVVAVNPPAGAPLDSPQFTGNANLNSSPLQTAATLAGALDPIQSDISSLFSSLNLKANISSPAFTGFPTAPTASVTDNSTALATTAFVTTALLNLQNTINVGSRAPISNPNFTGSASLNSQPLATQAFVTTQINGLNLSGLAPLQNPNFTGSANLNGVALATQNFVTQSIGALNLNQYAPLNNPNFTGTPTIVGAQIATQAWANTQLNLKANIASPTFTGTPHAPTPPANDESTRIATTHFVERAIDDMGAEIQSHNFAPLHSPEFTGMPRAPTPEPQSSDSKIATTAFVMNEITHHTAGVASFNTRTGQVTLTNSDIEALNTWARLQSPNFTGDPHAPTHAPADSSTRIATTAFVHQLLETGAVQSFNARHGHVVLSLNDLESAGGARINDPNFHNGRVQYIPSHEAPHVGARDDRLTNTRWVTDQIDHFRQNEFQDLKNQVEDHRTHGVHRFNQRHGDVTLNQNDITAAGGAVLRSPCFLGVPLAPTAAFGTRSHQIATTMFVMDAIKAVPSGPPGLTGPAGPIGPPGRGMEVRGTVDQHSQLPMTGNTIGDVWLVGATHEGYWWDGSQWQEMGSMQGAAGPPGPAGPAGPAGPEITVATTAPSPATAGRAWFNTANNTLSVHSGTAWHPAVPTPFLALTGGTISGPLTANTTGNTAPSLDINNQGTGDSIRIRRGTTDHFRVDAAGEIRINRVLTQGGEVLWISADAGSTWGTAFRIDNHGNDGVNSFVAASSGGGPASYFQTSGSGHAVWIQNTGSGNSLRIDSGSTTHFSVAANGAVVMSTAFRTAMRTALGI